jgi:hypothetical protein
LGWIGLELNNHGKKVGRICLGRSEHREALGRISMGRSKLSLNAPDQEPIPAWAIELIRQVERLNEKIPTHVEWVERNIKDHETRIRSLEQWRMQLDLAIKAGLVLMNSSGMPQSFDLQGGLGVPGDVPILGVPVGAEPEVIHAAWRRLMGRAHPDQGGTEGLAARLNAARDRLLRK